jgi:hypothetical protein
MEMLLFLVIVAGMIALAFFHSQISELRSALANLQDKLSDQARSFERRLAELEAASAARRTETAAAAAPQSTAAPISDPALPPSLEPPKWHEPPPPVEAAPAAAPVETANPALPPRAPIHLDQPAPIPAIANDPAEQAFRAAPNFANDSTPTASPQQEQSQSPVHALSLEERLGANWLNKLGIAILVIGLAFFLAYKLKTLGPAGKALTGLAVSLSLLGGGLWLERKQTYRIFARAGIGGGWALLFFTTFAMHHLAAARVISSLVMDLILMMLVAAGMVLHSLRYRSQTVTGLAFLLGFATVATSHLESDGGTIVFSLLASAVLALGLVVVTTRRHWPWLELAGVIGVMGSHFLWLALVMPAMGGRSGFALFWQSTALILFYWAIFRAAYVLRLPLDEHEDRVSSLTAIVTSGGVLGLLKYQSAHPEWAFWALLSMGTVELLLGIWSRGRRRSAFVVLTTIASVLLVAAVPFQFHGVSWPILWLVEAHALALCGLRLGEPVFRRLGLLAGFAASLVLAFRDVAPLAAFRLTNTDAGHHPSLTVALFLAAALFWLHGEVYPRRWPEVTAALGDLERIALSITSWLGLAAAATALWVMLPTAWVVVGWLTLVVLLGIAADWKAISSLALQADILAVMAIAGWFVWDLEDFPKRLHKLPSALAIALLYAGMRRRTVPENSVAYVAPAYSWIASLLLVLWTGQAIDNNWLVLAWAALAVILFEIGRFFAKGYLRWQSTLPTALAFLFLLGRWFDQLSSIRTPHGWFAASLPNLISLFAVTALGYWLQERTRRAIGPDNTRKAERWIGILVGAAATVAFAAWLPRIVPTWGLAESASIAWSCFATLLLAIALWARRSAFQLHGVGICLWTGLYGTFVGVDNSYPQTLPWSQSNLLRLGLASAILVAGLSFALPLRKIAAAPQESNGWPKWLKHPEQWFFFVPFAMMIITLAAELRSGNITLGWSLLGVAAFVFALLVGERSFRLGGLALLMLSVVKILLMDVWTLAPSDRYITLIVMGCALLLVSFLYTRFRDLFRRYL